ncbi:MAG: hypothetical protein ACOC0N_05410 [Chroococcales cyanobacterium]
MLTHHRRPVNLSLVSTDLPVWSTVETAATLYQKDTDRFHLVLNAPDIHLSHPLSQCEPMNSRLMWLEISPYRVILTLQGNSQVGYRHFWEQGVYGTSRYWLQHPDKGEKGSFRLRNFTRYLTLKGYPLPESLRVEYELWSNHLQLGRYVLNLDILH